MSLPTFRKPEHHTKGWGEEVWCANLPGYCGKILRFKPGAEFSTHFHAIKSESFYVLSGAIRLWWKNPENGKDCFRDMIAGEIADIPRLCVHRICALIDASEVIEFSTHHEDSDSYRVAPGDSQK